MNYLLIKSHKKLTNVLNKAQLHLRNNLMGNIMSNFLKFSLASVLAIGVLNISPVFAQEDGDVEEVIVTGSKIKKVDYKKDKVLLNHQEITWECIWHIS